MTSTGLERYQIMEALGSGAQASTFRAIDREHRGEQEREVAVKVFALKGSKSWRGFERFERECSLLAQLNHPGIPEFYDHFAHEQSGDYFLVMQLIRGQSLLAYIRSGAKLQAPLAAHLLRQGFSILGYLHAQTPRILHRDIKPANCMIDDKGALSLVDFGAALTASSEGEHGTMTMMGTPGYMAPEQSLGQAQPRSDIYALGITILAAICGQEGATLPRQGLNLDLNACLGADHPLHEFLSRCVAADPDQRFSSAGQAYDAIPDLKLQDPSAAALARQDPLPEDLQTLAQVKNPALRVLFWVVAQVAILALALADEVIGLVDGKDDPKAEGQTKGPLEKSKQAMESFSEQVAPFGAKPK